MKSGFESRSSDIELPHFSNQALNHRDTNVLNIHRRTHVRIIKNNILLVAFLNFSILVCILFVMFYYKWFAIDFDGKIIWLGLLYCNYQERNNIISDFIDTYCNLAQCQNLKKLNLSGIICFSAFGVGFILHCVFFIQILRIARQKDKILLFFKGFKPLYFKISALGFYLFGLMFWVFYNEVYQINGECGISLFLMVFACLLYFVSLIYYGIYKKRLRKARMIENLLNPDGIDSKQNINN